MSRCWPVRLPRWILAHSLRNLGSVMAQAPPSPAASASPGPSPARRQSSSARRGCAEAVLRHLPQRAAEDRRVCHRSRAADQRRRRRRQLGEGRPEAAHDVDAAGRRAAAGCGDLRRGGVVPRIGARSRRGRAAAARQAAARASSEPHRVSATPFATCWRSRRCRSEVSIDFLLPADNISSGFDNIADLLFVSPSNDGALSRRGAEDQPPGGRRPGDAGDGEHPPARSGAPAGRARRRAAVRHARRAGGPQRLPGRRHLHGEGGACRRAARSARSSRSRVDGERVALRSARRGAGRRAGGGRGGGARGTRRSSSRCRSRPARSSSACRSCSAPKRATKRRCGRACAAAGRSRRSRR